ncbi:MAG: sodium:calcium antiporter [Thermodesulfobacterium geofontis]|uniref:Sodium:calcium antiporter n=1 Tax=Thermodesulfobacterium geofontis TaxID=1295609 RepID=A0A2N7PM45_9BACT|nr:MAG: sodium:calcium antiporter [Thermodesulfobacterium geofontis]PMP98093.1 MAG: sodium:calcium antiporter [Thermodesulfobacterium geofontis]
MELILLILSLGIILICAELFTNGVEALGERLSLSQAVVGSILAAVGTALPETIIPLVAIFLYKGESGANIGVGAILGAPFMLTTMGLFLVGLGVFISYLLKKREKLEIYLEPQTFIRDFRFFLLSYSLAIIIPLIFPNTRVLHYFIALLLFLNYIVYLLFTFRADSLEIESSKELYFARLLKLDNVNPQKRFIPVFLSIFQIVFALLIMIKGAHIFVENLEILAKELGMDPLLFSLLLAPIATELPEKSNSLLWTLRKKDILALGNMTGAMVFQSTFPVSIGLFFTTWEIKGLALISALIALFLATFYLLFLKIFKKLPVYLLLLSGCAYLVYIYFVIKTIS